MVIYCVMYYFWSKKKTPTVKPLALQKNGPLRSFRCLGSSPTTVWAPTFLGYEHLDFQTNVVVFFHESLFALGTLKSGDAFNFQRNQSVHCPKWRINSPEFHWQGHLWEVMCQGSSCKGSCTRGWLNRAPRVNSWDSTGWLDSSCPCQARSPPPHLTPQNTKS